MALRSKRMGEMRLGLSISAMLDEVGGQLGLFRGDTLKFQGLFAMFNI